MNPEHLDAAIKQFAEKLSELPLDTPRLEPPSTVELSPLLWNQWELNPPRENRAQRRAARKTR